MTSPLAIASAVATAPIHRQEGEFFEAKIIDPREGSDWDGWVRRYPNATTFHTAAWARVLCRSYGQTPVYLRLSRGGEVVALLPLMEVCSRLTGRRAVSLPFSDFCEPLILDASVARLIGEKLGELMSERRWNYVELRGGEEAFYPGAKKGERFYGHKLSLLGGTDQLWTCLASPVRRAIRKATRSGVSVEVSNTVRALREFYQLHRRTRRRHGVPPQPFRFFENIYEEILAPDGGFIALARAGSRTIAAAIFFEFNGTAIYKFGASDDSAQELRANNLVMWEAIGRLAGRGCRMLHFGRTEVGNEGLRRFKRGWGAIEEVIQYFRVGGPVSEENPAEHNSPAFYHAFFRRLPLPVNGLAGALIYPHLD